MPDRSCSRGHRGKPVNGVCVRCREILEGDLQPRDLSPVVIEPTVECRGDYFPDKEERG